MSVSLQSETIDVAAEYTQLVGDRPGAAVATFTGYVRDHSDQHAVASRTDQRAVAGPMDQHAVATPWDQHAVVWPTDQHAVAGPTDQHVVATPTDQHAVELSGNVLRVVMTTRKTSHSTIKSCVRLLHRVGKLETAVR